LRAVLRINLEMGSERARRKFNRGAQLRGRSAPVLPVRLRRWRASFFMGGLPFGTQRKHVQPAPVLRSVFVAAQKLVSFDLSYHSNAAWFVSLGALNAAKTAHSDRSSEGDFMGQRQ